MALGDLNGDDKMDIVTANHSAGTVSVLLGEGDGTFAAKADYDTGGYELDTNPTSGFPTSLALGDLNGDGKLDLVAANSIAGTVSMLLGEGDGTFAGRVDYATAAQLVSVGAFSVPLLVPSDLSAPLVSVTADPPCKTNFAPGDSEVPLMVYLFGNPPSEHFACTVHSFVGSRRRVSSGPVVHLRRGSLRLFGP